VEADELEFGPAPVSAASSAISARYKTVKPRRVGARIPVTVVKALAADPAMRHSERGRELLRLLTRHALPPEEWAALVDAVPTHRAAMIVKLAESLSLTWQQFADELRRR
jgi:hypothetical protein